MENFWDQRYSAAEYVYGKEPNVFFKSEMDKLKPGKILIPGAGEGRDAVYAATIGWQVFAIDMSEEGKKKALRLAAEKNVTIQYDVMDIKDINFKEKSFDAIASIFFHLPDSGRKIFHHTAIKLLKDDGIFIMECFNPNQLKNTSGGPKDLNVLYTKNILSDDFKELKIEQNIETQVILNEGEFHKGLADNIRFIARKK